MGNKYYQQVGSYYDEDANDFDKRYWQNPVLQEIRQSFREHVKRFDKKSMLEIGCGTGIDLVHFGRIFPQRRIYGIDISNEMVRLSEKKILEHQLKNVKVCQGSIEDIEELFPGSKFDLIYVFLVH